MKAITTNPSSADLRKLLRRTRKSMGLTGEQVAAELGVSACAVRKFEREQELRLGLTSFLKYLSITDYKLIVNQSVIECIEDFGKLVLALAGTYATITEFAEAYQISRPNVYSITHGVSLSVDLLLRISSAAGWPVQLMR